MTVSELADISVQRTRSNVVYSSSGLDSQVVIDSARSLRGASTYRHLLAHVYVHYGRTPRATKLMYEGCVHEDNNACNVLNK